VRIEIDVLDKKSISKAISDLNVYKRELRSKMDELTMRAAEIGADEVGRSYAGVRPFDNPSGSPNFSVDILPKKKGYAIQATGDDVLYLEFGAGAKYGYGHPYSGDEMGMVVEGADAPYGPGTHSPKGHWNDPNGWWYAHGRKSYGNPPSAGMYDAKLEIERNLEKLKEEIFNG
jgi:hypothetical protein